MTDAAQKRYQDMLDRLTKIEARLGKLEKPEPSEGWQTQFADACRGAGLAVIPGAWFKLVKPHVERYGIEAVCGVMLREVGAAVNDGTLKYLSIPKLFAVAPTVAHGVRANTREAVKVEPPTADDLARLDAAWAERERQNAERQTGVK